MSPCTTSADPCNTMLEVHASIAVCELGCQGNNARTLCVVPQCARETAAISTMALDFVQNLADLLAEEQLARWEDLELAQGLQRMTDCVFCPRCSSACLEDAENCAQCPKCFFAFCSLCNESWHPGIEVRAWPAPTQGFECCLTT